MPVGHCGDGVRAVAAGKAVLPGGVAPQNVRRQQVLSGRGGPGEAGAGHLPVRTNEREDCIQFSLMEIICI